MSACQRRLWGLEDGLLCRVEGPHVAHVFEATTDDIGDHRSSHCDEADL